MTPFETFLIALIIILLIVIIIAFVALSIIRSKTSEQLDLWRNLEEKLEEQRERFKKE